jgi:hypothetical protein
MLEATHRRYRQIPNSVISDLRLRWDLGESGASIARDLAIDPAYVSRICRGKARETAPGPIGQPHVSKPLTAEEREQILAAVVFAHKHYGSTSRRAVAKTVGRDRHTIARVAARADAWVTRLFSYIQKGDSPEGCWVWTGGCFTALRKGAPVSIPRFMDGPGRTVLPSRWLKSFAEGIPLKGHLRRTCKNNLCVNPAHHRPARPNQEAAH